MPYLSVTKKSIELNLNLEAKTASCGSRLIGLSVPAGNAVVQSCAYGYQSVSTEGQSSVNELIGYISKTHRYPRVQELRIC